MDDFKMKTKEQEIINSAKEVVLNMSEKNKLKTSLISHMNLNPIKSNPEKNSHRFSFFSLIYHKNTYLIPALAIVLFVIGLNSDSNETKISSIDTINTSIVGGAETSATFSELSVPSAVINAQLMQVNEATPPNVSDENTSSKMVKSDKNIEIKSSLSKKVIATSTEESKKEENEDDDLSKSSVSKIKLQINETYKSFIDKIFGTKKSKEQEKIKKQKEKDKKEEFKQQKKDDFSNTKNKDEDEDDEDDMDKRSNDEHDDDIPVIDPLPPNRSNTKVISTTTTSKQSIKKYTITEVALHNKRTDCWSIVSGGVYDLTSWINKHPGGETAINGMCGIDATVGFLGQHNGDKKALDTIVTFKIGEI